MGSFGVDFKVTDSKGRTLFNLDPGTAKNFTLQELFEFQRNALQQIFVTVFKDEVSKGFDPNARIRVDGRFGKDISQVKAFGKIEAFSRIVSLEPLAKIFEKIEKDSPVDTGIYKSQNYVLYNNQPIANDIGEFRRWIASTQKSIKAGDTIRFINISPYARRLEYLGVTKDKQRPGRNKVRGRKQRQNKTGITSVPRGTYNLAYNAIRRLKVFKAAGRIKFEFIPGDGYGIKITDNDGKVPGFRKDGRPYLYPSILIRFQEEGLNIQ